MDVELTSAAEAGNLEKLQELLQLLPPPQEPEEWLRKSILRATYEGREKAVQTLLTAKADPTWVDERREASLHWAARRGHEGIAGQLLECKAEPNQQTPEGSAALHLAAEKNAGPIIRLLLNFRADQALVTREKKSALHIAAENGSEHAAAKLLEPAFDDTPCPALNMVNDRGETPLARAAMRGHSMVVQQLLGKSADYETKNWWGQGALQLAAQGGHVACVQALFYQRGDVDQSAQDGATPLHTACEKGHAQVVEILILNKGNLEKRSAGGRLPVHAAAARGNPEVMKMLLKYKSKLEERNDEGRTPLSLAAGRGHAGACRVLLERLADPQALDSVKQTPLHAAAANGQVDCVEVLLDHRTRIDALDAAGQTPIMLAHANRQESVVRVMLKRGAVLPEGLDKDSMGDVVTEVERERLQEMLQESQEGKNNSQMRIAERDFEDCRRHLLELAARGSGTATAAAVDHLETSLKQIKVNCNTIRKIEKEVSSEVEKFTDKLAEAGRKKAEAERDLKYALDRAATAKESKQKKQEVVKEVRKQLGDTKAAVQTSIVKASKLDQPNVEVKGKSESLKEEVDRLEASNKTLRERLTEVTTKLQEWHTARKQASILHERTQELLNRDTATSMSTPRDLSRDYSNQY